MNRLVAERVGGYFKRKEAWSEKCANREGATKWQGRVWCFYRIVFERKYFSAVYFAAGGDGDVVLLVVQLIAGKHLAGIRSGLFSRCQRLEAPQTPNTKNETPNYFTGPSKV